MFAVPLALMQLLQAPTFFMIFINECFGRSNNIQLPVMIMLDLMGAVAIALSFISTVIPELLIDEVRILTYNYILRIYIFRYINYLGIFINCIRIQLLVKKD